MRGTRQKSSGDAAGPPGRRQAHRLKRITLSILPTAFRVEQGEEVWRSLQDEWVEAQKRPLPVRVKILSAAAIDLGITALVEWTVAATRVLRRPSRLSQDLRWALRNVWRRPRLAAATILIMAMGIGSVGTVFSVVNRVLLRPLGNGSGERVVHLMATQDGDQVERFSHNNLDDLITRATLLESTAMRDTWSPTLALERPVRLQGALVTDEYFDVFEASPSRGRFFAPDDVGVVVVSDGFWRSALANDPDVVGRSLPVGGGSLPVIGVAAPGFVDPWGDVDVWMIMPAEYHVDDRTSAFLLGIGRLSDGATLDAAAAEIATVGRDLAAEFPGVNDGFGIDVITMKSRVVGQARPIILSFMGAGLLLLLLACANVATLLLGRAVERRREMAVRTALGAGRGRQLQQLITESLVLATFAGGLGTLLAWGGTRGLAVAGGTSLPRADEIALDPTAIVFLLGVTLATGFAFGVLPALYAAGHDLTHALRSGGGAGDHRGAWVRDTLTATQITLAVVLLVGAGLLLRSARELSAVDPGFEPDNAYAFSLSVPRGAYPEAYEVDAFRNEFVESLTAVPGVEAAGMINLLPLSGTPQGFPFTVDERPVEGEQALNSQVRMVSHGYAQAAGIDVLDGRWFTPRDRADAPLAIVASRAFAQRYLGGMEPLGALVTVFGESHRVVGVVEDVREDQLARSPRPALYLVDSQAGHAPPWLVRNLSTIVRSRLPRAVIFDAVRDRLKVLDTTIPISGFQDVESLVERHLSGPRFRAMLAGSMAAVAFLLALFGVGAAMAFSAARRTREVAIRIAVGGSPSRVLWHMMRNGAKVILLGVAAGSVGAAATTRGLSGVLYSIQPLDTLTFFVVIVSVAATAGLANFLPAARVVGRAPLAALKDD